jgi:hypothetical protein
VANRENLLACLRRQAAGCAVLGSPFYAALLEHVIADVDVGGRTWDVLAPRSSEPFAAAVVLRFLGAIHRLVLEGHAPTLARHYPSAGGDGDPHAAWTALDAYLAAGPALEPYLARPPQTNEVSRAAALVGGFLTVAREWRLPLRLLEIGASAGLNLRFDHYRYESGPVAFGDPTSPVRFVDHWERTPPFDVQCTVVSREGCDVSPVDPTTPDGRLTLASYIWPDQAARLATLEAALTVAARVSARITRAQAADWLADRLADATVGAATVVYHSIAWQYFADDERQRVRDLIEQAGTRATPDAPVAWLRLEPAPEERFCELRLRSWPGGDDECLARAGFHGVPVVWLG